MRRSRTILLAATLALAASSVALAQDNGPTSGKLAAVHTSFDPAKDGLHFPNVGSYVSPEGDCVGFSAVAIANAQSRAKGGTALDGLPAEAQAIAVQAAYAKQLHDDAHYYFDEEDPLAIQFWKPASDPSVGKSLHDLLASSGPQILELQAASFGPGVSHAVAVFGYENGHFLIYDSNSPDETHQLPFDPKTGFGTLEPYGKPTKLKLMDKGADYVALAAKLQTPCATLDGTCAANVYKVQAERVASDTAIVFSGVVTGGLPVRSLAGKPTDPPSYVIAQVGTRRLGETHVQADGSFTLQLPQGATGTVRLWAFTAGSGEAGVPQIAGYSTTTFDLSSPSTSTSTSTDPVSAGLVGALQAAAGAP